MWRRWEYWWWAAVVALVLVAVLVIANRADAHPPHLYPDDGVMTVELVKHRSAWLRLMELEARNGPYREEVMPNEIRRNTSTTDVTTPPLAPEQIRALVEAYFPPAWVDEALAVSRCESNWIATAKNRRSSAAGLFQFLRTTWDRVGHGWLGYGTYESGAVYDPAANVASAAALARSYHDRGQWRWAAWVCQP